MSAAARIREIPPTESLANFIALPWRTNAADPNWVPPLRMVQRALFNRSKHPFHQHADVSYFIAERNGRAVGRVAAINNHLYNDFHGGRTGFWGFFECADEPQTASALLAAAEEWLRMRGMESMLGPTNFSTNDEGSSPGLLIEGFDTPPAILMSHNPRFYPGLVEQAGHCKAMDLLAYAMTDPTPPERVVRGVERLVKRSGVVIRTVDVERFADEVNIIKEIYNSAWENNWGFAPMTDAEFDHLAAEMRPIIDPELILIAEAGGEPVGFLLALPDFNQALKKLPAGRLFPLGFLRLLWERRKIDRMRILTLGLKPGHQHKGLGAALYLRGWQNTVARGYTFGEGSWVLEDNEEMRRPLENIGATAYKRYRVYQKAL